MNPEFNLTNTLLPNHLRAMPKKLKYRYRLVDFKNKRHKTDILLSQTKCNIDIIPDGIMVVGDFNIDTSMIPVMKDEIESITLIKGKEVVDTFYLSPMYMLSKLGIPNNILRLASILPHEYKIGETQLIIKTSEFQLSLITSGNRHSALLKALKKNGYRDHLNLLAKPSINALEYATE